MMFHKPHLSGKKSLSVFGKVGSFVKLFFSFCGYLFNYVRRKVVSWSLFFEHQKNTLVRIFTMKRGRYSRPFLHMSALGVLALIIVLSPLLADTYPVLSNQRVETSRLNLAQSEERSITMDENVLTAVSDKPRDEVITYTVQKGDTISTIAEKFGISTDTIRWANDMSNDTITVGDDLKIPPVTGIVHKVAAGDTIYTIAKKYNTEPQGIVDFPFNDFANPETFSLVSGQQLIVPNGIKPSEQPTIKRQVYIATGPVPVKSGGFTFPVRGNISQFASWYHMALDIENPVGAPIVAAHNGTVTKVSIGSWDGGYGTNVMISNGSGVESLYAHMSGVNVSVGQSVSGGSTVIGWVGMTGRTTGPHVHFEIRQNGSLVNPISYVQ